MTAVKKFLFDTPFDAVELLDGDGGGPECDEGARVFTKADVEAARQEGFAAGKEEGVREAAATTEHRIMECLTALSGRLSELFGEQQNADAVAARNAVATAAAIARKVLPDLNRKNALGEVERLVEMAMEKLLGDTRVVVRVNPELRDPLAERIDSQTAGGVAEGRVNVLGEPDLPLGDCRIEWSDGGVERNTEAMWKDIDDIIARNLGPDGADDGAQPSDDDEAPVAEAAAETTEPGGAAGEAATDPAPEGGTEHPEAAAETTEPDGEAGEAATGPAPDASPADAPQGGDGSDDSNQAGDDGEEQAPPGDTEAQGTAAATAGG